jgi:5-methylcytosine-specific restriction endonuclease McrA
VGTILRVTVVISGIIASMAKYNKENLQEAVKVSFSLSDMARHFGKVPTGGTLGWYRKLLERHQIDTSHFTGQAHGKGKRSGNRKSAKDILKKTSAIQHGWKLKRSLLEIGIKNECAICGMHPKWNNLDLTLVIDHINGINTDHRPENLRILCPNCHSQTDTFAGKNNR